MKMILVIIEDPRPITLDSKSIFLDTWKILLFANKNGALKKFFDYHKVMLEAKKRNVLPVLGLKKFQKFWQRMLPD
jgi:hypothetical protein